MPSENNTAPGLSEPVSPTLRTGDTVAHAVATLRRAGGGPVPVLKDGDTRDDAPEAELWLSDPGLRDELAGAKEVQQRLLPRVVPTVPGFEFAGRYVPAGHVGGDYWSVKYYREEGVVTCKLADVTGHGIGAAILVAAVKFVSGVLFRGAPSPAWVMERTNHSLLRETSPDKMATMIYAWVYPQTRRVRLVNAGHFPAFLCRADGTTTDIAATGPLLGLIETNYEEKGLTLTPGDLLFFCSDGVSEAADPTVFNDARVKEIVAEHRALSADALADVVLREVLSCCGEPKDDMSLLIIKASEVRAAAGKPARGGSARGTDQPAAPS